MEFLKDLFVLLGRLLISGMFLWGAYDKIKYWNSAATYMKSRKVPQVHLVLPITIALKIIGGLAVFFGWHAHIGALLLLIVAVPSVLKLHAFWNIHGDERNFEKILFTKEVAIIGGLLLILALGSGHFSVH